MTSEAGSEDKNSEGMPQSGGAVQDGGTPQSRALIETQTCPGCGRASAGDYCPDCGREVGREPSVVSVFSGLFREIADIESGFWPTLRALSLRPGRALGRYLRGDRRGLMHPGRYLLAAIILSYATNLGFGRAGLLLSPGQTPQAAGQAGGGPGGLDAAFRQLFQYREAVVVSAVAVATLLALTFGRLFRHRVRRGADALAFGTFLTGHATLLASVVSAALVIGEYLLTGDPVAFPQFLFPAVAIPYVWTAALRTFGPGASVGMRAALALAWTAAEYAVASTVVFCGFGLWILWRRAEGADPEAVVPGADAPELDAPEVDIPAEGLLTAGGLGVALLLLHAAGEAYVRYQ
jgi:hypothetical protein